MGRRSEPEARAEIEALIARTAIGERDAFAALYQATSAKLLGVCLSVLKDRDTAEDVLQEVFVKIWKNADRYAVNGLSPMTWLITIARNASIDRLRKQQAAEPTDDLDVRLAAPGPSPESSAVAASDARRIVDCLDKLPDDRREAVTGAYLKGFSYDDLARKFDVPMNTMRSWLRRSLISLRECMAQ